MSRHFRVLLQDKAAGRTYRMRRYVCAESADDVRAMFPSFRIVGLREVKP